MNILVITQLYPQPDDQGANKPTRTVEFFCKEWVSSGHNVFVMHCSSKFPKIFYFTPEVLKNWLGGTSSNIIPPIESRREIFREEHGIKIFRFPMFKLFPGMGYSTKILEKQAKIIVSELTKHLFLPELVVGHFANPSTALVAILAKKYNSKSSIVFHHDCTRENIQKYRIKEFINEIGAIGARSILEAKQIQADLNLDKLPFVCYSGVPNDAVEFAEKECHKMDFHDGIRHIYVGSLIRRKHLDVTIKAFLSTKGPNDTLSVVGGGPEESKLRDLARSLDKTGSIYFFGRISRHEALEKMKKSQIFTLISDGETFGMVYIEAMLQGCLVIASKGGGFDGIIRDGVNGFLCNPGDSEMLETIYRRIQGMSDIQRNRIGQNAIDTALHYSEREVAERYLNDILANQKQEAT